MHGMGRIIHGVIIIMLVGPSAIRRVKWQDEMANSSMDETMDSYPVLNYNVRLLPLITSLYRFCLGLITSRNKHATFLIE